MNAFEANAAKIEATSPYLAAYIRPDRPLLKLSYYTYNLTPLHIVAGTSAVGYLKTLSDSDFLLETLRCADANDASGVVAPLIVQITDLRTKQTFYSEPTPLQLVMGGTDGPFVLPVPRVLPPITTLRFDFTNPAGANDLDVSVTLGGYRIFYGGSV